MVVFWTYGFYLVDVFPDAVRMFLLFPVYFWFRSFGWIDGVCYFLLRDGRSRARRSGSVAFYGDCSPDDLFTAHGGDGEFNQNICLANTWNNDIVVHCGWRDMFVVFTDI